MGDPYFLPHPYRNQNNGGNANINANHLNINRNANHVGYYSKSNMRADSIEVVDSATIGLSLSVGEGSKTRENNTVALGNYACACSKNSIAIGNHVSTVHENAITIGSNISSKKDNSVLIDEVEFTKGQISCGDNVTILHNKSEPSCKHEGSSNAINSLLYCDNKDLSTTITCGGCNGFISRGVTWVRDGYRHNDVTYSDITCGLCFDCIYDCVLEHKAKLNWSSYNFVDPLDKIRSDIKELQELMKDKTHTNSEQ
jgi:hypothetical protein